jgi:hypothetical protein
MDSGMATSYLFDYGEGRVLDLELDRRGADME